MQAANLLAIETSNQYCSVALSYHGQVFARHELAQNSHSDVVLVMVRALLQDAGASLSELDALVAGVGPGGFTGVRLAVAVVQGLAFASDKPVIGLSSLAAFAWAAHQACAEDEQEVWVAMDARMQQVYWARYHMCYGQLTILHAPDLCDVTVYAAQLSQTKSTVVLAGNAFANFVELQEAAHKGGHSLAPIDHSTPHAADLLPLAYTEWELNQVIEPKYIQPLYVRDKIAQTIAERENNPKK